MVCQCFEKNAYRKSNGGKVIKTVRCCGVRKKAVSIRQARWAGVGVIKAKVWIAFSCRCGQWQYRFVTFGRVGSWLD